jgi:hypothetical protein
MEFKSQKLSFGLSMLVISLAVRAQSPAPASLLGTGRGVDHVPVAVRDLDHARKDFEQLGFKFSINGQFPGGIYNTLAFFNDSTYLELFSVKEPPPPDLGKFVSFLSKHEGAMELGLNVSSVKGTSQYLKAHNFDVSNMETSDWQRQGEAKPQKPLWYAFGIANKPAPGLRVCTLPIFFIEYVNGGPRYEKSAESGSQQPNTALGIHAVWFAVHDSKSTLATLNHAGFSGNDRPYKLFGVAGHGVNAGAGIMVLLEGKVKSSEVARYLTDPDDRIIAISIKVADLKAARSQAETATHARLQIYKGAFGRSFLIPANAAHGLSIEMFQP